MRFAQTLCMATIFAINFYGCVHDDNKNMNYMGNYTDTEAGTDTAVGSDVSVGLDKNLTDTEKADAVVVADDQTVQDTAGANDTAVNSDADTANGNLTTAEKNALNKLFPGATYTEKKNASNQRYFEVYQNDTLIGYVFEASNQGFDGPIRSFFGIKTDGISVGFEAVAQVESWWYRMQSWFFEQFKNIDISKLTLSPKYTKNCSRSCPDLYSAFGSYGVDGVSNVTYTSNAVAKDVMDSFYMYDELP